MLFCRADFFICACCCFRADEMELEMEGEAEGGTKQQHQIIEFFEMCSNLITALAR